MSSPSSSEDREISYNFWCVCTLAFLFDINPLYRREHSELSKAFSDYYLPSPPEDPPPTMATQHQLMYDGGLKNNDQRHVRSATGHPSDASLNMGSSCNVSVSCRVEGRPYPVHNSQLQLHGSSSAEHRVGYDFWKQDSELFNALHAEPPGFVHHGLSSFQPQQNYYLPSPPEDPPATVVAQHQLMYDGDSTNNDQAPAHLEFSRNNGLSLSDSTHSFLENGQYNIHIAAGQPSDNVSFNDFHSPQSFSDDGDAHTVRENQSSSHGFSHLLVCKWKDDRGLCNKTENELRKMVKHVRSSHLPPHSRATMKCQWEGCKDSICRDTIFRHIRQIHLEIGSRRQA
ncbi:uncharacterized protein EDB93DRAFT_1184183 [Suillus bovinus]|uniref:uncharacterized protein n=1 Tax=Suillus bovinus TaxID=48563 RepID=UPI001B884026|nr:uncharacterized protein EDB93DRAFT_1184183 [Suillus bovinus]KAG2128660.1 hypothetical protein EDB93DRAFT_1184183 [Suillus bovinus]